jgi:hypothetical protein
MVADNAAMLPFVIGYTAGSKTASRAASLARSAAVADRTHHTNRVEDLSERIDSMAMILRGMWALLEENGYTADQLLDRIEEIDLADGMADGRITVRPIDCPSCGSKVAAGLATCQFCGTQVRPVGDEHPLGDI